MKFLLTNFLFTIACLVEVGQSLRNRQGGLALSLDVPKFVRVGDSAVLQCNYDLGNEVLYSMKWYKGNSEFYRYTPKESPPKQAFPIVGINIDLNKSNSTQVTLTRVELNTTAKYSCEVTTDSPDFNTGVAAQPLYAVVLPRGKPLINIMKSSYSTGDWLNANCTSYLSKPGANLTWYINNELAHSVYLVPHKKIRANEPDNRETTQLSLHFQIRPIHFINGHLQLKCIARIYNVYAQQSESVTIEDDRPKISSVVDNMSSSSSSTSSKGKSKSQNINSFGSASSAAKRKYDQMKQFSLLVFLISVAM